MLKCGSERELGVGSCRVGQICGSFLLCSELRMRGCPPLEKPGGPVQTSGSHRLCPPGDQYHQPNCTGMTPVLLGEAEELWPEWALVFSLTLRGNPGHGV